MADFFHMGGYAIYVWSSYGLALLIVVGLLVASLASLRRRERMLATLETGLPRRRRRAAAAGGGDDAGLVLYHGKAGKNAADTDASDAGDGGDGGGGE